MADDPEDHDKDSSTTGNESDQETKTSEDNTMTADEEDDGELPATAGAGQSTSEMWKIGVVRVMHAQKSGAIRNFLHCLAYINKI